MRRGKEEGKNVRGEGREGAGVAEASAETIVSFHVIYIEASRHGVNFSCFSHIGSIAPPSSV